MAHESFLATVAEDVKNLLAAHDQWSESFTPTREWMYYEELEEVLDKLRVAVVALRLVSERVTRAEKYKTAVVHVIIQEKPRNYTQQRMDQLASLSEQVFEFFEDAVGQKLPNVNAQMQTDPRFATPGETLIEHDSERFYRQFATVIETEWRTIRA